MKKLNANCSRNSCYYLMHNLLSYSLLSKNVKVKIYKTIILPFVLYGYETWSPTVSEEHGLRMFGDRVLRKISGPTRDKVTGEWERWHNETLYNQYSPNICVVKSRRMRWVGHVAHMGKRRGAYRILMGRPEGRRPLGRPRLIKMDLQEVGWMALTLSGSWQGQVGVLMNTVMNLWVSFLGWTLL